MYLNLYKGRLNGVESGLYFGLHLRGELNSIVWKYGRSLACILNQG